jgi:hypothetical protein
MNLAKLRTLIAQNALAVLSDRLRMRGATTLADRRNVVKLELIHLLPPVLITVTDFFGHSNHLIEVIPACQGLMFDFTKAQKSSH